MAELGYRHTWSKDIEGTCIKICGGGKNVCDWSAVWEASFLPGEPGCPPDPRKKDIKAKDIVLIYGEDDNGMPVWKKWSVKVHMSTDLVGNLMYTTINSISTTILEGHDSTTFKRLNSTEYIKYYSSKETISNPMFCSCGGEGKTNWANGESFIVCLSCKKEKSNHE